MAETLTRRSFSRDALSALLTYSLLDTLGNNDLFADKIKPVTRKWLTQVNDLGLALKKQKLKPVVWQKQVEELFGKVELPDLLKMLDFDRLTKGSRNGVRRSIA